MAKVIDEKVKRQLEKKTTFFLKYFPVRIKNVGEDAVEARKLVWAFKDAEDGACEKVAQMTYTEHADNLAFSSSDNTKTGKNNSSIIFKNKSFLFLLK